VLDSGLAPEQIKNRLVSVNPLFFLVPSTNPRNTYKVLWYNLHATSSNLRTYYACKIDILVPGVMNIPTIPKHHVVYSSIRGSRIPVAPFIAVLLLKLQGWADHRVSHRMDLRNKQHVDVDDIYEVLRIAVQGGDLHVRNEPWLPEPFVAAGRLRVRQFILGHPDSNAYWRLLGLLGH
jgi:hypothetical protein